LAITASNACVLKCAKTETTQYISQKIAKLMSEISPQITKYALQK
jgi:hypothetical protein